VILTIISTGHPAPFIDFFLSHSPNDLPWVRQLKAELGLRGFSCWLAEDEIGAGMIGDAVNTGLHQCCSAVIVASHAYFGRAMRLELQALLQLTRRRDMPIYMVGVDVTPDHVENECALLSGFNLLSGTAAECANQIAVTYRRPRSKE
jgi:hypothetical protein